MPDFDAILFDLGGTLIYFDADWPSTLREADSKLLGYLQSAGYQLDAAEFLLAFRSELQAYYEQRDTEFVELTTRYLLHKLLAARGYPRVPASVLNSAMQALYGVTQTYWKPEADAHAMLDVLKAAGYRLGIISNAGDDADVQVLVDKAQLRPYFDQIITSASRGIRKPDPLIFQYVLREWGISPERVMMVGDTLGADVLGARNAGLFSVWITRRADTAANRAHAGTIQPDATIHTLAELPPLLERLRQLD